MEKILAGNSNIRNPILVSYVAKGLLPYHGLGSGIKRALKSWPDIEFKDDHEGCLFTATIHRKGLNELVMAADLPKVTPPVAGKMAGKVAGKILEIIQANNTITIAQLAEMLSLSHRTVERHVAVLRQEGLLDRRGPAKGGKWEVLE